MILFQFTGLTAGDVIEISQTKQQVSAPIQPPNTPPPFLLALQRSPLVICYLYNERGDSLVKGDPAYPCAEVKPFTQV